MFKFNYQEINATKWFPFGYIHTHTHPRVLSVFIIIIMNKFVYICWFIWIYFSIRWTHRQFHWWHLPKDEANLKQCLWCNTYARIRTCILVRLCLHILSCYGLFGHNEAHCVFMLFIHCINIYSGAAVSIHMWEIHSYICMHTHIHIEAK